MTHLLIDAMVWSAIFIVAYTLGRDSCREQVRQARDDRDEAIALARQAAIDMERIGGCRS